VPGPAPARAAATTSATASPAEMAPPASPAPAPAPAVAAAATPSTPASVDAALELLQAGRTQELAAQLPAVIGRILPLLRLLGPNQRAQLVQFLQK